MNSGGKRDPSRRTSKYRGVSFHKDRRLKPWRAEVHSEGSRKASYHVTELEAARAYDAMVKEFRGAFAKRRDFNFPA